MLLGNGTGEPLPGMWEHWGQGCSRLATGCASSSLSLPAPSTPGDGGAAFLRCCFPSVLVVLELWHACWAAGPSHDEEQKFGDTDFCVIPSLEEKVFFFHFLFMDVLGWYAEFSALPPVLLPRCKGVSLLLSWPAQVLPALTSNAQHCPHIKQGRTKRPQSPQPPFLDGGRCPPMAWEED